MIGSYGARTTSCEVYGGMVVKRDDEIYRTGEGLYISFEEDYRHSDTVFICTPNPFGLPSKRGWRQNKATDAVPSPLPTHTFKCSSEGPVLQISINPVRGAETGRAYMYIDTE